MGRPPTSNFGGTVPPVSPGLRPCMYVCMKTAEELDRDRQDRLKRPGNIMGEGGGAGNGQSRVVKMRCPM